MSTKMPAAVTAPKKGVEDIHIILDAANNPLVRVEFRELASLSDHAVLHREFLLGRWGVFDLWAERVLDGWRPREANEAKGPHATFWRALVNAHNNGPEQAGEDTELTAFLKVLLLARTRHEGLLDTSSTPSLPNCTSSCRGLLTAYLQAFEDLHYAEPLDAPLGGELKYYTWAPEPALIGLAGNYKVESATAPLIRFLKADRRYYKLDTDYSTEAIEITAIFDSALLALIKIANAHPSHKAEVQAALSSIAQSEEHFWWEEHQGHDYGGGGGDNRKVHHLKVAKVSSGSLLAPPKVVPKLEGLQAGLQALREGRNPISRTLPKSLDHAIWVRPIDISSALEGRIAALHIQGDRLFYLGRERFAALDLETGNEIFRTSLSSTNYERSLDGARHAQVVANRLWVPLERFTGGGGRAWELDSFDVDTGQLLQSMPLTQGPHFFQASEDAIVFADNEYIWHLAGEGKRKTIADYNKQQLAVGHGRLVTLVENGIQVASLKSEMSASVNLLDLDPTLSFDEVRLLPQLVLLLSKEKHLVMAIDYQGKKLWEVKLDDKWSESPRLFGETLGVRTAHFLYAIASDGTLTKSGIADEKILGWALHRNKAYIHDARDYLSVRSLGGEAVTILGKPMSHMATIVRVDDRGILLQVYDEQYYLALLPLPQ